MATECATQFQNVRSFFLRSLDLRCHCMVRVGFSVCIIVFPVKSVHSKNHHLHGTRFQECHAWAAGYLGDHDQEPYVLA